MLVVIPCRNGWVRVHGDRDPSYLLVRVLIMSAIAMAEQTARPAYREMIDTLDWGAIL